MSDGVKIGLVCIALLAAGCGRAARTSEPSPATSEAPAPAQERVPATPTATASVAPTSEPAQGSPSTATAAPTPSGSSGSGGPAPIARGTYRFRQTGTSRMGATSRDVPPEGTLAVDAPRADGTQDLHRFVDEGGQPTDTVLLFRADGMFVVSTVLRAGTGADASSFTCTFEPPVPSPPWPPEVGKTFSGHGECGGFTADVQGTISGPRTATVGADTVETYVIATTVRTSGQVESTITLQDWFAPAMRLPVHTEMHASGTTSLVSFSEDRVDDLVSAHPTR